MDINSNQRKSNRFVSAKESNEKVTQVKPWSQPIKMRQMKWFGHLTRLPDNTPAKTALKKYLNE